MKNGFMLRPAAMVAMAALVVGCGVGEAPTTSLLPDVSSFASRLFPPSGTLNAAEAERLEVCKRYQNTSLPIPATTTFNFESAASPDSNTAFDINSAANNVYACREIWVDGDAGGMVTVTEPAIAGYRTFVTRIQDVGGVETTPVLDVETNTASGQVSGSAGPGGVPTGQLVLFTNIEIFVPPPGCTYTQGYWKTHSLRGPAPYDDSWLLVGAAGSDTPFYFSGKTWFELFWTPPAGGNVYIQLAHQYMAAKINVLNGATPTAAVTAAITAAETFFNNAANTPTTVLSNATKNLLKGYASTLGSFNEGTIGPGHCNDESPT